MPSSQKSEIKELANQVRELIIIVGGNPLEPDISHPHHPSNSLVGQLKASSARQDEFEERVGEATKKMAEAGLELAAKIDHIESHSLSKKAILAWLWRYKVRIGLALLILILEGPRALRLIYSRWLG